MLSVLLPLCTKPSVHGLEISERSIMAISKLKGEQDKRSSVFILTVFGWMSDMHIHYKISWPLCIK